MTSVLTVTLWWLLAEPGVCKSNTLALYLTSVHVFVYLYVVYVAVRCCSLVPRPSFFLIELMGKRGLGTHCMAFRPHAWLKLIKLS